MLTGIKVGDAGVKEGEFVTSEDIVAAHILPSSTTEEIVTILEMTLEEMQGPKNGLFLCKKIEVCFDHLELSFIPTDMLNPMTYKCVIWREACKSLSVYKDRTEKIGDYDNKLLKLGKLEPFRRALSYQAFLAYDNLSPADKEKF